MPKVRMNSVEIHRELFRLRKIASDWDLILQQLFKLFLECLGSK